MPCITASCLPVCLPPDRSSERAWPGFEAAPCPQHIAWGLAQVRYPLNGGFINGLMAELAGWLNSLAQGAKEGA